MGIRVDSALCLRELAQMIFSAPVAGWNRPVTAWKIEHQLLYWHDFMLVILGFLVFAAHPIRISNVLDEGVLEL
jgi:hypothetical protein